MLYCSGVSLYFDVIFHGDKRGDISVDDGIPGFGSQEISHSSFHNWVESVDGDGKSGYRYHTIHPPITQLVIVFFWFYLLLLFLLTKLFMVMKDLTVVVMIEEVGLCIKRQDNLPFTIV